MAIEPETQQQDIAYDALYWRDELARYKEEFEKFTLAGRKITKRYKDDRSGSESTEARFNILWSNIRTLKPAIYSKVPKIEVNRRNKDQNDVARVASMVLERAIAYELAQYPDYHTGLSQTIDDRLLVGRGISWVRYEPKIETVEEPQISEDEAAEAMERVTDERSPVDYVFWEDFAHLPARTWEEVTWVARRVFMSRDEGVERFGDIFQDVPLTHSPDRQKDDNTTDANKKTAALKKAVVWEIWCKPEKTIYWVAEHFDELLDSKPDPLELEQFFPCPKPLYSTVANDSLVPVADFKLYQDQADELDEITGRIRHLTKAMKVMGVYAADEPSLARLMKEGNDAVLVPVTNWPAFMEKGGLLNAVQFVPLKDVVAALQQLYEARNEIKQTIYEITGISDILRGASMAQETATAQQIKSQYASIRLNDMKDDAARFARDLLRIKAEIICTKYQPEVILQISGIASTPDRDFAPQAIALLKNEPLRNFAIDIQTDTLVEIDEQSDKQSRMEFLTAAGQFLEQTTQAAQIAPEIVPLATQMLLFGVRGFKIGREIEGEFERFVETVKQKQENPEPPKPDPEQMKVEAQAQQAQASMQLEQQRMQVEAQTKQLESQLEQQKMALEQQKAQFEAQLEQQRMAFDRWKAEQDNNTKILIAQMQIDAAMKQKAMDKSTELVSYDDEGNQKPSPTLQGVVEQTNTTVLTALAQMLENMQGSMKAQTDAMSQLMAQVSKPRQVVRDANGRIAGVH